MRAKAFFLSTVAAVAISGPVLAQDRPPSSGDVTEVSEVVVTAAPYAVSLGSVTTSVNVITRDELDVAPPVGLGDLLNGEPGLRSSFFGPGASRPIIRGLSGPRVLILQNGVGLVDASSLSPDHAVASEPGDAQRIEVLRGPSTLAYGGSAIGGVVNIIDERVPLSVAEDGFDGRVSLSYDTNNDGIGIAAGFKGGSGPIVVAVDAVHRESGDYDVPTNPVSSRLAAAEGLVPLSDRTVLNSDVELNSFGIGVSWVGDDGYLGGSVKRTETTYGVPFPQVFDPGPPDPDAEGPVKIELAQTRYDLRGEHGVAWGPFDRARFSIGYADYQHAEIEVESGALGTQFLSRGGEGRIELVQRERDGWQGAVGIQGLVRSFEAIGDEAFIPPVGIHEQGAFTLQRHDRGAWGVEGGLRIDRRALSADLAGRPTSDAATALGRDWSTTSDDQDFTNVSASAAVFLRPGEGWFAALSLSHNARAPTEFELFADGPHAGTGAYEIGDPRLDSEKVTSLEATLRWTGERGRLQAHLFSARYDGFIEQAPTGVFVDDGGTPDPDGELPVFSFFQTDATFWGGELEGEYDVWSDGDRSLSLTGAFDYVRGDTGAGAPARIPPYSVTAGLAWASPRLDAKLEIKRVGEQDRVATFELPTDGYTLLNAAIYYKPFDDRNARLFIDGRNLTDEEAREHASFLKDIAPNPGRSIRFGVAYRF